MQQPKPFVQLTGNSSNAFAIMGLCQRAAREAGWSKERIEEIMKEMKSGDYDNLLQTAMKYFDVG